MKIKGLLGAALGMFLLSGTINAQFTVEKIKPINANDRIPFYLDAEFTKDDIQRYIDNRQVLYPVPIPAEVFKMPPGPDKILSGSGVELTNISQGASGHQSETWITIDPNNPKNLIATANDMRYMSKSSGFRMSAWYSKDGGKTWKHSLTPKADGMYIDIKSTGTIFDPGISFNSLGEAYYLYGFTQTDGPDGNGENGLYLSKSTDGGETWAEDMPIWQNDASVFNDRFSMTIDYQENSPYKDRIYVSWARMSSPNQAVIAKADYYDMFSGYEMLWGAGGIQSPVPAVGPDGEVYCVWQHVVYNQSFRKTEALISKSTNGGKTWSNPRIAQTVFNTGSLNSESGRYVLQDKANMRVSSVPYLDVDRSNSPRRGWVYVVQSGREKEQGDNGLYLTYSTDGGENWVKSYRIDENEARNDIFFPSISVDPITGNVAILYYSSQNDPEKNQGVDAFIAVSQDGVNFIHLQLTDTWYLKDNNDVVPQGTGNYYWGDYTSLVFYNGKIHPCFWMPTAADANAYSVDLFTADLSLGINKISDLTAENQVSTDISVKLTWKNPAKDMFELPIDNYTIHVFRDGTKLAELAQGTTEYIDKTVVDGETYSYEIKIVTEEATSEGVGVTIQAGGSVTPANPEFMAAKPVAEGIELKWKNPAKTYQGTEINGTLSLDIYSDDVKIASVSDNLTPGELTTYVLKNVTLGEFYNLSIKSVITRGESIGESAVSQPLFTYAGAPMVSFTENFDGEIIPLYKEGSWGTTNLKAASGEYSFTDSPDGNYDPYNTASFITAPIVISQNPAVVKWSFISLINKRHYMKVLASKDNGRTWEHLSWTNIETSDKFKNDVASSDWFDVSYDLKQFFQEGDVVFLKFYLDNTNQSTAYDGYYIDDLAFGDFPVAVDTQILTENSVSLSPNPTIDEITISYSTKENADVRFGVYDMLGNQVLNLGTYVSGNNETKFTADVSSLPNGAYMLKAEVDGSMQAVSFVIAR